MVDKILVFCKIIKLKNTSVVNHKTVNQSNWNQATVRCLFYHAC